MKYRTIEGQKQLYGDLLMSNTAHREVVDLVVELVLLFEHWMTPSSYVVDG